MVCVTRRAAGAGLLFGVAAAALPVRAIAQPALSPADKKEADRQAILRMAGDFHVRFDMRETASFVDDYVPLEPKISGGNEIVRVVSDTDELIQLQHILVVEHEGQNIVVKHWRQDWAYEPESVLAYERANTWRLHDVSPERRQGAWAQTVWQTDDSPRYGGVGVWRHDAGISAWTSEPTLRPLARRDAIRNPPYDHYRAINRHAITPTGWVHEQNNMKVGMYDGAAQAFVDEFVINTYDRADDFPIEAGVSYWQDTEAYWAGVRAEWERLIAANEGVYIEEEPQAGVVTGPRLMELASSVHDGELTTQSALSQAREIIIAAAAEAPTRA